MTDLAQNMTDSQLGRGEVNSEATPIYEPTAIAAAASPDSSPAPMFGPKATRKAASGAKLKTTTRVPPSPAPIPGAEAEKTTASGTKEGVGSRKSDGPGVVSSGGDPPKSDAKADLGPAEPPFGQFDELRIWAEMYADAQQVRIQTTNRVSSTTIDADIFGIVADQHRATEHAIKLQMVRCYRRTVGDNIRAWQVNAPGIGEHLLSRLLGDTGHPAIAQPYHWEGEGTDRVLIADAPYLRTLRQWWSYCGLGDPNRKRRKGMTAEEAAALGRPAPKFLVRLLAECCVKARQHGSPYAGVYDAKREVYAHREDWSKGRQHAAALRVAGKEILRDLWVAARNDLNAQKGSEHQTTLGVQVENEQAA